MTPMSPDQKARSFILYRKAAAFLKELAEERLNLDPDTRAALDRARGSLEEFDRLRIEQPTQCL